MISVAGIRAGSAMRVVRAAKLRDAAALTTALGAMKIEILSERGAQHGQTDDSYYQQRHSVYGHIREHLVERRWSVDARSASSKSPTGFGGSPLASLSQLNSSFSSFFHPSPACLLPPLSQIANLGHDRDSLTIHDRHCWRFLAAFDWYASRRLYRHAENIT